MQRPHKKKINKLTPNLLYKPIQEHLADFKDDLYDKPRACPEMQVKQQKKAKNGEKAILQDYNKQWV